MKKSSFATNKLYILFAKELLLCKKAKDIVMSMG